MSGEWPAVGRIWNETGRTWAEPDQDRPSFARNRQLRPMPGERAPHSRRCAWPSSTHIGQGGHGEGRTCFDFDRSCAELWQSKAFAKFARGGCKLGRCRPKCIDFDDSGGGGGATCSGPFWATHGGRATFTPELLCRTPQRATGTAAGSAIRSPTAGRAAPARARWTDVGPLGPRWPLSLAKPGRPTATDRDPQLEGSSPRRSSRRPVLCRVLGGLLHRSASSLRT